ncbi:MAG: RND multidrug efflux transporter; Acriflavin resistance protein [uncultured Sulfurovum sp.]|uniref:RND multidrug efflux transporter Acriflavin resistance protein n=1 Tax=uncultured Sulfurovum sp. TaxID=269237 RepID=A0A6S6RW06_9BACT|nr:MAG: RND multidrug efflux transporter; Acriflavin resistance protein [uncultured Sulfurovum sp.]
MIVKGFIRFAVDKPIINHIFMVFMILLAIFAYQNIPKEIFPPSTLDKIVVTGGYAGTSADVLDKMVVKTIEDDMKSISAVESLDTVIQNGGFSITAQLKSGNDKSIALDDVKDVIANVRRDLPSDMSEPVAKTFEMNYPLLIVAISGDVSTRELLDIGKELKSKLSAYQELSGLTVYGDVDDEVLISINDEKINAYGLSKEAVYQAISNLSSIFPIGTLKQKGSHLYISTINGEKEVNKLESTLITVGATRIRLGDIANVSIGLGDGAEISHFNGVRNVSLNINKTKEGNAIALSKQIKEELKTFSEAYPHITFDAYTDTSIWIKNRLNLVSSNILFGLILVFMALLLSVNYRIAFVVAIGIPASFMITIIVADMAGYSLNMLTLLGALIALGMIVDEAIVVAENIYRHIEMGKSPREAAIDGAVEMFPAVLTATLTTVFAFLPLLIMSGEMGVFMKVLPIMISILLISSLFEAFYFLPLHAKEFFSIGKLSKEYSRNNFWIRLDSIYHRILATLLRFKKMSLFIIVTLIILATMGMLKITKFKLFPEFDTTQIYLNGKIDINNKLEDTERYVSTIEKDILALLEDDDLSSVTSIVGVQINAKQEAEVGENLFHIFVNLHEKSPENFIDRYIAPYFSLEYDGSDMIRHKPAQEIVKLLQKKIINDYKEMNTGTGEKLYTELNVFAPQAGVVGNDIEVGFSADDTIKISHALAAFKSELAKIDGVKDISDNAKEGVKELKLRVNEYGQQLGFSEAYVTSVLRGSFLKAEYGKMFNDTGLIRIRIEDPSKDKSLNLETLKVATPDKMQMVKLSDVCDFSYQRGYVKIFKEDSQRVRSVTARIDSKKVLATDVMKRVQPLLDTLESEGITVIIKGEEKENQKMKREMTQAAMIAIFLIFITLVWMFNSLIMPLIIISSIPLSIVGALVGQYVVGLNLSMPGVMGIIGLAGVVVNDGLIMLSVISKKNDIEGVIEGAKQRLRPILLTSLTTVLGLFTLMFFASGQALILQPMAISLGFGVAWATVLNLYYVPLMYVVIYRVNKK